MKQKLVSKCLALALTLAMALSWIPLTMPAAKAAAEPGAASYLGRNFFDQATVAQYEGLTADDDLDASPGLADFTRPDIIDYIHFATRGGVNGSVEAKYVKAGVEGSRLDITGTDGGSNKENNNILGIFAPKYTDGTLLGGDGTEVSTIGRGADLRKNAPIFYGNKTTVTYTAPSADGENRTLEIYLDASGGTSISAMATMNNISVATVSDATSSAASNNKREGYKYVFAYTGDENEYPLVVKFTLNNNNAWAGLQPMAACILEGGTSTLTLTGGAADYKTAPFDKTEDAGGQFLPGQEVTITVDDSATPFGKVFAGWTGDDAALLGDDVENPTATFTMPNRDVTIAAAYEDATTRTITVTGGTAEEIDNPDAEAGTTIEAYVGSTISLSVGEIPQGVKFKNWTATSGDVTFTTPNTFVMPDEDVEVAANYRIIGTATPGISNNTDPETGTEKYNDYQFSRYATGFARNPIGGTTPFSDVSNREALPGVPQIDDNLSAPNVLDWMRYTNTGSGEKINRKADENDIAVGLLTGAFTGTVSSTRENATNEARKNIRLSYSDGVSPAEDGSSYSSVRTGTTAATFTAPSAEGIERTLDVYLTFQATSNRILTISATMPKEGGGTYNYTTTADLLPALSASKMSGRYAAKFSFNYVGDAGEAPLTVKFSLNNSSGNMGVHGVRLTEGAPEAQIYLNVPDLTTSDKYAIVVPGTLFQRRYFPATVTDKTGAAVEEPKISYSYEGLSENVAGETEIPGIAMEQDGMLYIYPEVEETMIVSVIATATVSGEAVSAARSVRIVKDENRHDMSTRTAEEGPLGKNAGDWELYFNDDFDGPELDTTAWIPQYLQSWSENKDNSEAKYEMVQDTDGNGYLALGTKEQRPDFTEGFNGTNDGGDQPIVALYSRDRHHQHLLEDGRGDALDADLPDFDTPVTTKYGYFETRLRLPSTGDGAHFAWWMVGAQDDTHPTQALSGPEPTGTRHGAGSASAMYDFGPGGWGNYAFYTTDQGVEYDVMEVTLDANSPNGEYNKWLPVIHKNGSRSSPTNPASGRWYAGSDVSTTPTEANPFGRYEFGKDTDDTYTEGRNTYQEFHVYGFEWDETGTRFYLDGRLVYTSTRTADYRMLTFLSIYIGRNGDGDGYGHNHGYWPKEAMFDYFRIYKKAEPVPTSIVINGLKDEEGAPIEGRFNTSWDYFRKGSAVQLSATVLDQFEKPYDMSLLPESVSLKWRFSDDIGGSAPLSSGTAVKLIGNAAVNYPAGHSAATMTGLALNPGTGEVTVAADAPVMNQDIFLTAYLADSNDPTGYYGGKFTVPGDNAANETIRNRAKYQETKHIKISDEAPRAHRIFFLEPTLTIAPGETVSVKAMVYDQYNNPMPDQTLTYVLSKDVTLRETVDLSRDGISLSGSNLTAAWNATQGKQIMVRAQLNGDVYQNLAFKVEGEQGEPPYIPPTGGGGSSSTTTTTTEKNEDGSTTTTVTDKKTGDVTEITKYSDGTKITVTTPKGGNSGIEVTVPKEKDSVTVTVPTAQKPTPGQVAVIIHEDGTREVIKTSVATEAGMRVTLGGNAKLELVDNSKSFSDISGSHWASDAVVFAASRELFQGTGKNSFSPAGDMTRSMLITVLARLDGQDTTAGDTWYSAAMTWGTEAGITDGSSPNAPITRESLAVMLYRYTKDERASGMALSEFSDADRVSDWAAEAMSWAVANGILNGSGGKLNPGATATRAEVATMLQRLIENMM